MLVALLAVSALAGPKKKNSHLPLRPFAWPTPKLLRAVEVPAMVKAQGIPTQLRAVLLGLPAEEVLQVYVSAFQAAGFYIPPVEAQHQPLNVPILTALDVAKRISYSVILEPHTDGTTTAILGEANLALMESPSGGEVAPLFPGAKDVLRTDQEGARLIAYEAPAAAAKVEAFYRETLGKAGWAESEEPSEKGSFRKDGATLQIMLKPKGEAATSVVIISGR